MTKLPTGVPGLDVVLGGGLEPGSAMVLAGAPGTGKTTLAQQICFAAAATGSRAVYYTTLSEPHSKMVRHLASFDFYDPRLLGPLVEHIHLGDFIRSDRPGRMEPMVEEIVRKTMDEKPSIVVIDSSKALRDFTGERELRMAFYDLTSRLAHTDAALLLLGEYTSDEMESGVEFSLADGIIQLAYEPREPIDRRWVRIRKMRGTHHLEGKHTFRITAGGFEVFPRIETRDPGAAADVTGRIGSGIPGLDPLMGGGIGSGEATVVLGPSGVGKTIFGLKFVSEGLANGERCLYVTFQDTADQLITMAAGFGWDLQSARDTGQLVVHHVPLGELDLDLLTSRIGTELATGSIRRVVIDSLAEMVFAARESERFPAYARSLTGLVRSAGASLVITSETTTLGPTPEPVGGVTFLFHNLILLRYIEQNSATGRALNIVKMRNSDHNKDVHQFDIDEDGLTIGSKLEGVTGVLGWSALRHDAHETSPAGVYGPGSARGRQRGGWPVAGADDRYSWPSIAAVERAQQDLTRGQHAFGVGRHHVRRRASAADEPTHLHPSPSTARTAAGPGTVPAYGAVRNQGILKLTFRHDLPRSHQLPPPRPGRHTASTKVLSTDRPPNGTRPARLRRTHVTS